MKTDEKISVIIPVYNSEKYLRQTLDCICSQTYKNLEIICVLDCPTDHSAEIVQEITKKDSRVKLVEHSQNKGLPAARNSGVENATGEYLHFMDSDDLTSPNFYETLINAAVQNDADVVTCSVFYEKKPKQSILFLDNEVVLGANKIKKTKIAFVGWAWRYLIKRNFWDKHTFSFPDLVPLEDLPVMLPMIYYANKVVTCSDATYFYKNRESSILNTKLRNLEQKKSREENRRKALKIKVDFVKKHRIKLRSEFEQRCRKYFRRYLLLRKDGMTCQNDPIEYGKINKKISVIIPIYNAEKYLKQTLDSVRFQTYKNLEVVCVLDCPSDHSAKIAKEIADEDSRIKLVEHTQNRGLPAARNSGVENATGEYIHFMDADDLISPDFYEIMISAAVKNDADVSACSVFYEKKQWRSIWFAKSEVLLEKKDKIRKTEVVMSSWAWSYLIKKNFWNKHDFSFPDLVPMEDKPVMLPAIYHANKVALCPNAVYFYKNREDSSILREKYNVTCEKLRGFLKKRVK